MKQTTRVLIADDAEFMRNVLSDHMKAIGCEVVGVASDGKEATKLYFEEKPDLLLMDIQMPVLNGWEATQLILSKDKNAKIVLLSGSDKPEDEVQSFQVGALDYIKKPIASTHSLATRLKKKGLLGSRILEEPTPVKKENGEESPDKQIDATIESVGQPMKETLPSTPIEPSPPILKEPTVLMEEVPVSMQTSHPTPFVESPSIVETSTEPTKPIVDVLNNMRPQRTVFLQEATEQQLEKQSDGPIGTKSNVSNNTEKKSLFSSLFTKFKS